MQATWNNTYEQGVSVIKITHICTRFQNWPSSQESPILRGCTLGSPSWFDTSSLTLNRPNELPPHTSAGHARRVPASRCFQSGVHRKELRGTDFPEFELRTEHGFGGKEAFQQRPERAGCVWDKNTFGAQETRSDREARGRYPPARHVS